ncbi:MAG: DUF2197 domain-containing protein [Firmicutes bacterium]|nr:DUF2197 domain-containing protein [Bacillota bacterium]
MKTVEAVCTICGKNNTLNKLHKDFRKVQANPGAVYVCEMCSNRLSAEATKENDLLRKKS